MSKQSLPVSKKQLQSQNVRFTTSFIDPVESRRVYFKNDTAIASQRFNALAQAKINSNAFQVSEEILTEIIEGFINKIENERYVGEHLLRYNVEWGLAMALPTVNLVS